MYCRKRVNCKLRIKKGLQKKIIFNICFYLKDPTAKIGKDCRIGPNVIIGANVVIEDGVCINRTTVLGHTHIESHCWIQSSIIGWKCKIGKWVC